MHQIPMWYIMRHVRPRGSRLIARVKPRKLCRNVKCRRPLDSQHVQDCQYHNRVIDSECELTFDPPNLMPTNVVPVSTIITARTMKEAVEATGGWSTKKDFLKNLSKGNLGMDEYKNFTGMNWLGGQSAQCRSCDVSVFNGMTPKGGRDKRDEHLKTSPQGGVLPCSARTTIISEYLRADNFCTSCGKKSKWIHWGVPLCQNQQCVENFMFWPQRKFRENWEAAKEQAAYMGWSRPRKGR